MTDEVTLYVTNIATTYDYENNEPLLHFYGRTTEGYADEVVARGLPAYFHVLTRDADKARSFEDVTLVEDGYKSLMGESLSRVYTRGTDWDKRELAANFDQTYDGEVRLPNRARIEGGIFTGITAPSRSCMFDEIEPVDLPEGQYRVLTIDIETDDRGAFPQPGEKRVTTIVAHDSFTDEYTAFFDLDGRTLEDAFNLTGTPDNLAALTEEVGDLGVDNFLYQPDEESMLRAFAEYVGTVDPDVITAWNVDFDAPYLIARFESLGIDPARLTRTGKAYITKKGQAILGGRTVYDLFDAYKKTKRSELKSYSLNSVAEAELGEQKIDHTGVSFWELYQTDPAKFVRYCAKDVALAVGIDEKASVLAFKKTLSDVVGVDLDDTVDNHQLIEMFARRELKERGVIGPDSRHDPSEKYEGAVVFPPFKGLARNVTGLDLASLYPWTLYMFNISPETKVDAPAPVPGMIAVAPNGQGFDLREDGVFKALVKKSIGLKSGFKEERDEYEPDSKEYKFFDERYAAAKTITNSTYGTLGWEHFFLYDRDCAEAITLAGQAVIKATRDHIGNETLGEVIYGDTDSNYVKWPDAFDMETCLTHSREVAATLNESVYPALAESFGIPGTENKWQIELELYAETYFQHGKKKKYAMRVLWKEGKQTDIEKIVGYTRSDVSSVTQGAIDKILKNIVREGGDPAQIGEYVMEAASHIVPDISCAEQIGIPGGLGKEIGDYEWTNGTPKDAHPRAAYFSNSLYDTNYGEGSKPMRIYVKPFHHNAVGEVDVLAFDSVETLGEAVVVDVQRMTDSGVVNPLRPILEAAGVDVDAALRGQTQTGLDRFF